MRSGNHLLSKERFKTALLNIASELDMHHAQARSVYVGRGLRVPSTSDGTSQSPRVDDPDERAVAADRQFAGGECEAGSRERGPSVLETL